MSRLGSSQAGRVTRGSSGTREPASRLYDAYQFVTGLGPVRKGKSFMMRKAAKKGLGVHVMVASGLLLAGTAGCGSPVPDKPATAELRAANSKPEDRPVAVKPSAVKSGQEDSATKAANGSPGSPLALTTVPRDADDQLNIPDAVAKDLGSSDARERYRALDYWEKKDSKAPIDPIYDLMEDDDPAVRAKAAAILERYTEAGVERE